MGEAQFYTDSEEDIVGLFAVAKEVFEPVGDENVARGQTPRMVGAMLKVGMVARDPSYPGGYAPWENQAPDNVLDRIQSEWRAVNGMPDIPDTVWFGPPKQA